MLNRLLILIFFSISLSACADNSNDKNMVNNLIDYKYPKSICYGRLTITVPKETEVNFGNSEYDGIKIEVNKDINSYENFKNFINKNIHELKNTHHISENNLLNEEINFSVNGINSHIVVFRSSPNSVSMYQIYGYLYLPLKKSMLVLKGGAANGFIQSGVEDIKKILSNIKFSPTNKPGTCFDDFFIEDYDDKKMFMSEIYFSFPSYPEVRISIDNRSRLTTDEDLIKFSEKNLANIPITERALVNIKDINIGERKISLMEGKEYSHHLSSRLSFNRGYEDIVWQYLGEMDDIKKSYVKYDLSSKNQNGDDINALVDQKRVIELGYFILNNLKNNDK